MIKERKWMKGPKLLNKIGRPTCVALPFTMNYHCAVFGNSEGSCDSNCCGNCTRNCHIYREHVYGLNKSLTAWNFLGKFKRTRRLQYIALPIS